MSGKCLSELMDSCCGGEGADAWTVVVVVREEDV